MTKVQEYLHKKRLQDQLQVTPKLYFVKSTREGVDIPLEIQVTNIIKNAYSVTYEFEEYPCSVTIKNNETSSIEEGHGTGVGDLWSWSYYYTLSLDDAEMYYKNEILRIQKY